MVPIPPRPRLVWIVRHPRGCCPQPLPPSRPAERPRGEPHPQEPPVAPSLAAARRPTWPRLIPPTRLNYFRRWLPRWFPRKPELEPSFTVRGRKYPPSLERLSEVIGGKGAGYGGGAKAPKEAFVVQSQPNQPFERQAAPSSGSRAPVAQPGR